MKTINFKEFMGKNKAVLADLPLTADEIKAYKELKLLIQMSLSIGFTMLTFAIIGKFAPLVLLGYRVVKTAFLQL